MPPTKILIVDDEPAVCESLREALADEGYAFSTAHTGRDALESYGANLPDLVLLDINLPDWNGLDLLRELRALDPGATIIMATAQSDIATVVGAIKEGAENYLTKPFYDIATIKTIIHKALGNKALREENRYLKSRLDFKTRIKNIVGNSPKMQELYRMIEKIAPLNTTILLIGETGTGKEVIAQAIHQYSHRAENKFISINCGSIPESLLESTLFGYEKGAFTGAFKRTKGVFEEAHGGTLFLDEIGETSPALQVRLLRVLQDCSFQRVGGTETIRSDVRIISATNKDLLNEVRQKKFRDDLFYRLNVITLFIPALRERLDDLPLLCKHFIAKYAQALNKPVQSIDDQALKLLLEYAWPGNIRELENIIERAVALNENKVISPHDLPETISALQSSGQNLTSVSLPLNVARTEFEKQYLRAVLDQTGWNITRASQIAGLPRQNLHLKIKKLGLRRNP